MRSFLFSGRNQNTARRVALQGRKERKVFMKKTLLIVAMLLLVATPVMASTTVKVLVNPADQFTASDGNKVQPVSIAYVTDVNVRAFALDINVRDVNGAPNFQRIYNFKTGESNAASPGYGIFPSRFREFIVVTDPNWGNPNYNPTVAWAEPGSANTGIGFPKMIVEMGALYAGDGNKPAWSGTLFKFDVNAWGAVGTFHIDVAADTLRGGVVSNDGNQIVPPILVLEGNDACFPPTTCVLPDVVSQPEAVATAAITNAGFTLGNRTTACSDVPGIIAGDIISTNPAAGVYTCGIPVDYVVSTGPCCVIVPNVVGQLCSAAPGMITGVGLVVGNVTTAYSTTVAAGYVISQNPPNPNCVPLGSAVDYVCSLGIAPPSQIWYPRVDHDLKPTVVWTPVTGATTYKLERNLAGGAWAEVFAGTNTGNYVWRLDTVASGINYRYRVRASNALGDGTDYRTGTWDCNSYLETCYDNNTADGNYAQWTNTLVGRPRCWCFPRQCHGDADGKSSGVGAGKIWVTTVDLDILSIGYLVSNPAVGTGVEVLWASTNNVPAACADFRRKSHGVGTTQRVGTTDLDELSYYYLQPDNGARPTPSNCVPGNRTPPWW